MITSLPPWSASLRESVGAAPGPDERLEGAGQQPNQVSSVLLPQGCSSLKASASQSQGTCISTSVQSTTLGVLDAWSSHGSIHLQWKKLKPYTK